MENRLGNLLSRITTRLLFLIGLFSTIGLLPIAQAPADEEHLLKAVFIYNFAKLTRWPENIWPDDDAPMVMCTLGRDVLAGALEWLAGKTVKGRKVVIHSLNGMRESKNCHVLYIAASERGHITDIIRDLHRLPVLTVSEIPNFTNLDGMIELLHVEDGIRFKINLDAVRAAGLELSSRLLSLAIAVVREDAP